MFLKSGENLQQILCFFFLMPWNSWVWVIFAVFLVNTENKLGEDEIILNLHSGKGSGGKVQVFPADDRKGRHERHPMGYHSLCWSLWEGWDMEVRSGALHNGKILSSVNKVALVQKTIIGTNQGGERSIIPRPNGPVWPRLMPQGLAAKLH